MSPETEVQKKSEVVAPTPAKNREAQVKTKTSVQHKGDAWWFLGLGVC